MPVSSKSFAIIFISGFICCDHEDDTKESSEYKVQRESQITDGLWQWWRSKCQFCHRLRESWRRWQWRNRSYATAIGRDDKKDKNDKEFSIGILSISPSNKPEMFKMLQVLQK
jgi:hypothetical protein